VGIPPSRLAMLRLCICRDSGEGFFRIQRATRVASRTVTIAITQSSYRAAPRHRHSGDLAPERPGQLAGMECRATPVVGPALGQEGICAAAGVHPECSGAPPSPASEVEGQVPGAESS
jgi:hypothetical protein